MSDAPSRLGTNVAIVVLVLMSGALLVYSGWRLLDGANLAPGPIVVALFGLAMAGVLNSRK